MPLDPRTRQPRRKGDVYRRYDIGSLRVCTQIVRDEPRSRSWCSRRWCWWDPTDWFRLWRSRECQDQESGMDHAGGR